MRIVINIITGMFGCKIAIDEVQRAEEYIGYGERYREYLYAAHWVV